MAHHTDFFIDQPLDELHALVTAFEFDGLRAAFFDETQRIAYRVVVTSMKRSVRHVGDKQRTLHGAADGFQMNKNFIQCHRYSVAVTEHHISQAVADEYYVDSGLVDDARRRIIVSCKTNQPFASLFAGSQRRGTNLLRTFRLQIRHFQLSLHHDLWTIGLPERR